MQVYNAMQLKNGAKGEYIIVWVLSTSLFNFYQKRKKIKSLGCMEP